MYSSSFELNSCDYYYISLLLYFTLINSAFVLFFYKIKNNKNIKLIECFINYKNNKLLRFIGIKVLVTSQMRNWTSRYFTH